MTVPLALLPSLLRRAAVVVAAAIGSALATFDAEAQKPVRIRAGLVSGVLDESVMAYKGIPYGAPPLGELRWKPPQPAAPWNGVREATASGHACPQLPAPGMAFARDWSEDCLTIDVWTPARRRDAPLPVLVIIPGGGFSAGGSADPRIDSHMLVSRGVVVVSFNYRLNVFGFFAHPSLAKESPSGTSGNYGLMDQIAALRWIHDNISAFGGDPSNVTISGNSAGGSSVLYLMVSPMARGLFARAIAQSAALTYGPLAHRAEQRYGLEAREAAGERLGADLTALRALPAEELLKRADVRMDLMLSTAGQDYWPIVDGTVLPDDPWMLFDAGRFARVPLIIGSATDEGTLFSYRLSIKTPEAWREHLGRRSPGAEAGVQSAYAVSTDADVRAAANRWINDWYFHGTARAVARAASAAGIPVFLYSFSRVPPLHPLSREDVGAFHSSELEYLSGVPLRATLPDSMFGVPLTRFPNRYDAADRALAQTMGDVWARFALTGDPNGPGLPAWQRYQRSTDRHLEFGTEVRMGTRLHAQSLDVFDSLFARMHAARR